MDFQKLRNVFTFKSENYYDAIKSRFIYSRIFGLWPRSLKRSSEGVPPLPLAWTLIVVLFYSYLFYLCLTLDAFWESYNYGSSSSILGKGLGIQTISTIAASILVILINFFAMGERMYDLYDLFIAIDNTLIKEYNLTIDYTRLSKSVFIIGTSSYIFLLVLFAINYVVFAIFRPLPSYITTYMFFLSNLPMLTIISNYTIIILGIRRRFEDINNLFRQLKNEKTTHVRMVRPMESTDKLFTISGVVETPGTTQKLKGLIQQYEGRTTRVETIHSNKFYCLLGVPDSISKLVYLHNKICDAVDITNKVFGFQMLVATSISFAFIVFGFFSVYRSLYNHAQDSTLAAMINCLLLIFYYFISLISITGVPASARNQGLETGIIVHKVVHKTWDPIILQRLSIASEQLTMRQPIFTCGLFNFDWSLVYAVITATTTYLVFLIQFDVAGTGSGFHPTTEMTPKSTTEISV